MSYTKVVAITGCDSGLGWALAAHAAREGLVTVAGMYNGTDTEASQALKQLRVHPYHLDVTNLSSVCKFQNYVKSLLQDNPHYKLYAVVNNAGIMSIGDYEWQTPKIIEDTINVNLLGAMRVVSAFLPDLRLSGLSGVKPRIINIASHCGLQPLPGFGPYCASKAGILAWTRALHLEQFHNGLNAVAFIPGGFIGSSHLMSETVINGNLMLAHLSEEQKLVYERKIISLINYIKEATVNIRYDSMSNEKIIETFLEALTSNKPKRIYKIESWRYKLYYNLLKIPFPDRIHKLLINRFLSFPETE